MLIFPHVMLSTSHMRAAFDWIEFSCITSLYRQQPCKSTMASENLTEWEIRPKNFWFTRSRNCDNLKKQKDKFEFWRDGAMSNKVMLLGIAVILSGIALSISNIFSLCGGIAGLAIVIVGLFMRDDSTKH